MVRVLVCVPWPQDSEHSPYTVYSAPLTCAHAQSTGQWCSLQALVSSVIPQATPPCATGLVMERVRVWVPVPQETGHSASVQTKRSHSDIRQSTGQASLAQLSTLDCPGQV